MDMSAPLTDILPSPANSKGLAISKGTSWLDI